MPPKATILIVEDNPLNMELAVDLLKVAGYRVLQAVTAEEALPLAFREKPELILMDIALPGMNGREAALRLRQHPVTCDVPVIALTASTLKSDIEEIQQAGLQGIIHKPIDTRRFADQVAGYLGASLA